MIYGRRDRGGEPEDYVEPDGNHRLLKCLPISQPWGARYFWHIASASSSRGAAKVSFQRLRNLNCVITLTISTIWPSL